MSAGLLTQRPGPLTEPDLIDLELAACRDDPARFQRRFLGRELWSRQEQVCAAVARSPVTVVPAGRAVGKSFLLAGLVLWWLYTRPEKSQVITTGPDFRQVVSVLWKELRRAIRGAHYPLGYDHLTEGYASPQRFVVRGDWGALGFAAQYEEGFSGQHAPDLLVIVDEASGIKPEIWNAIDGLAATRVVIAGNPIRYDCVFRERHELAEKGSSVVCTVPISSTEHPHSRLDFSPIGAVNRAFLHQMREIHGEESPWWRSNILGQFPGAESVRFLPAPWLDACTRETITGHELWKDYPAGPRVMGVDVGGGVGADRSAVVVRDGRQILECFASAWHGVLDDARDRLEPVVLSLAQEWMVAPDRIVYDKGGPGRSFGSYLAAAAVKHRDQWLARHVDQPQRWLDDHAPPTYRDGIGVGYFGSGRGGKHYVNRRTACAFALKRRLDPHRDGHVPFYCGGITEWPKLREELLELRSPTMEMEEGQVKQRLEDKCDLAARLGRSPDLLDALLMTFCFEDPK